MKRSPNHATAGHADAGHADAGHADAGQPSADHAAAGIDDACDDDACGGRVAAPAATGVDNRAQDGWWYFYLVRCEDGSLYAGVAIDVIRRIATHNSGRGARYTRSRLPVELVYCERHASRSLAMRREADVKTWSKARKEALVASTSSETLPGKDAAVSASPGLSGTPVD